MVVTGSQCSSAFSYRSGSGETLFWRSVWRAIHNNSVSDSAIHLYFTQSADHSMVCINNNPKAQSSHECRLWLIFPDRLRRRDSAHENVIKGRTKNLYIESRARARATTTGSPGEALSALRVRKVTQNLIACSLFRPSDQSPTHISLAVLFYSQLFFCRRRPNTRPNWEMRRNHCYDCNDSESERLRVNPSLD